VHNPRRALLSRCVIISNNSRTTDFVISVRRDNEDSCFDELEKVMLVKASFLALRRASRLRTCIRYTWPNLVDVEVEKTIRRPVPHTRRGCMSYKPPRHAHIENGLPGGTYDCSFVTPPARMSSVEYNLEKHHNKFGTPIPLRCAFDADKDATLIGKDKLMDRTERTSNDSVMDVIS